MRSRPYLNNAGPIPQGGWIEFRRVWFQPRRSDRLQTRLLKGQVEVVWHIRGGPRIL